MRSSRRRCRRDTSLRKILSNCAGGAGSFRGRSAASNRTRRSTAAGPSCSVSISIYALDEAARASPGRCRPAAMRLAHRLLAEVERQIVALVEQLVLAFDVVVERRLADIQRDRDFVERHIVEAAMAEGARRLGDRPPGACAAPPRRDRRRRCSRPAAWCAQLRIAPWRAFLPAASPPISFRAPLRSAARTPIAGLLARAPACCWRNRRIALPGIAALGIILRSQCV